MQNLTPQAASARFEARITPQVHTLLRQAATLQGRNLSDFVISAAYHAASEVLKNAEVLQLTAFDQQIFAEALARPAQPNRALQKAIKQHDAIIRDDTV